MADAIGEPARDEKRDRRFFGDRRLQRGPREERASRRLGGDSSGGMRSATEQRHFAKRAAGRFGMNDVLARRIASHDTHPALEHHPPSARLTAGEKRHLVRVKPHFDRATGQRSNDCRRRFREQRQLSETTGVDHGGLDESCPNDQ